MDEQDERDMALASVVCHRAVADCLAVIEKALADAPQIGNGSCIRDTILDRLVASVYGKGGMDDDDMVSATIYLSVEAFLDHGDRMKNNIAQHAYRADRIMRGDMATHHPDIDPDG